MSRYFHANEVKMNGTSRPSSNGHLPMNNAGEATLPGVSVEQQTDGNVLLRCGDDEVRMTGNSESYIKTFQLCVRTVVLSRHSFENDTWGEIERIQVSDECRRSPIT